MLRPSSDSVGFSIGYGSSGIVPSVRLGGGSDLKVKERGDVAEVGGVGYGEDPHWGLLGEALRVGRWSGGKELEVFTADAMTFELLGLEATASEFSVRRFLSNVPRSEQLRISDAWTGARASSGARQLTFWVRPEGRAPRFLLARWQYWRPGKTGEGEFIGVLVDQTEAEQARQRAANALRESEQLQTRLERAVSHAHQLAAEASSANHAKSYFLANVSHEIRTPLNAVIGMGRLLEDSELSGDQIEYVRTIRQSSESLLCLINDILDFSKIESGKLEMETVSFEVRECIESALDLVAAKAAERNVDLSYHLDASVPVAVAGDPVRLRQVIVNLVSNAVKFTSDGDVSLVLSRLPGSNQRDRVTLRCSVIDTGIGIPADRMALLFQSFQQIDASTTRTHGGTGLGLAICKKLVGLMGGRIWAESEEGAGSCFMFEIPFPRGAEDFPPPRPARCGSNEIVVVADRLRSRRHLVEIAESLGLRAEGRDGFLEHLPEGAKVAILDWREPTEARQRQAELEAKGLRVILCQNLGEERRGREQLVLHRPVKLESMLRVVEEACPLRKPLIALGANSAGNSGVSKKKKSLRILLTEDNPVNQRVAQLLLKRLGYEAAVANNGQEALDLIEVNRFDLVLMDVQMPVMDGLTAAGHIVSRYGQERPLVAALTADAMAEDRRTCLAAGMDDYISKPVRLEELERVVGVAEERRLQRLATMDPLAALCRVTFRTGTEAQKAV